MKFVCQHHTHVELGVKVIYVKKKGKCISTEGVVAIDKCPKCYEFARRNGKQHVYNVLTKNLSDMIAEKKEEEEEEEEEEEDDN
jgi:hypothetical protein